MMGMDKRQILIIKRLINRKSLLSSEMLASVLGTTSRTVRSDMQTIGQILGKFGARVVSKPSYGYTLEIFDPEEFRVFLQSFNEKYMDGSALTNYNDERSTYIIYRLLSKNGYIKVEQLADELFISHSTMAVEIKRVRRDLSRYRLKIIQKPNYGIRVTGAEEDFRRAVIQYMDAGEDNQLVLEDPFIFRLDQRRCQEAAVKVLLEHHIHVGADNLQEICKYLVVMENRVSNGFPVTHTPEEVAEAQGYEEYAVSCEILEGLSLKVSPSEVAQVALLLVARRNLGLDDALDLREHKDLLILSEEILREIFLSTDIHFAADRDLTLLLMRELRGMLVRIKYHLSYLNISITEIKGKNIALEYAVFMSEFLEKKFGFPVDESEVAVLAQYLKYAIFDRENKEQKRRVCLVFRQGKNDALNYQNWLWRNFSGLISRIGTAELYEFDKKMEEDYDVLISNMPEYRINTRLPFYQTQIICDRQERTDINHILSQRNQKLARFEGIFREELYLRDLNCETRQEVLEHLCRKMSDYASLPSDFYDLVKKRDDISSTERGNNVAILPSLHPVSDETLCAVAILRRPIVWDQEPVQLVFLLANGRREEHRYAHVEWLLKMSRQMPFIHGMLHCRTFQETQEMLRRSFLAENKM